MDDALDRDRLLATLDGDEDALREIVALFLETSPDVLRNLRGAVRTADPAAIERSAHQLKGTLANLQAAPAAKAATELERLGRNGVFTGLEDALEALETELGRLEPALRRLAGRA